MTNPTKAQQFVRNMNWMLNSGAEADAMTTPDLLEALCGMDRFHSASLESAIFGEVVFRLSHPWTWRLRRRLSGWHHRWLAWKWCRKKT